MDSHASVIDTLGGGGKLAERLSKHRGAPVGRNMVYQWKRKNRIPPVWWLPVVQIAQSLGKSDVTMESLRDAVAGPDTPAGANAVVG